MTTLRRQGRPRPATAARRVQATDDTVGESGTPATFGCRGLSGWDEFPGPPDCSFWARRQIEINGVPYDVIRRPRLFRYAALRHSQDPAYEDRGELPNGGDPEDLEHQNQSYESRLWCLEFDIDKQGEKKTVRVIFGWPQYCPSFEDIERPGVDFPHGVKTFLGHTLYPISMRMDDADPSTCQMTAGGGWDFSTVREIRFVLYEDDPFGQLAEDRAEAASASGGMRVRGRNTVYVLANREEIYNKWKQFKRNGGTRLKAFFDEQRDLCARLNFDTLSALQKAVDSERKRREAAR